jgi:hypothetical protein
MPAYQARVFVSSLRWSGIFSVREPKGEGSKRDRDEFKKSKGFRYAILCILTVSVGSFRTRKAMLDL